MYNTVTINMQRILPNVIKKAAMVDDLTLVLCVLVNLMTTPKQFVITYQNVRVSKLLLVYILNQINCVILLYLLQNGT